MKNKGTLILTGLVLILGLYAYFGEYQREIRETERKDSESKIISLNRDQIQKIIFDKGMPNPTTLERGADGWDLTSPLKDQADNDVVESFLDQITSEKSAGAVGEGKSVNWEDYGLDKPMGTIFLESNSGQKQMVEVSMKKNFEGMPFLRRDQEARVLIGSAVWQDFLSKSNDHFRNLRVFRPSISKIDRIKIRNSKGNFEVQSREAQWVAPAMSNWKLDQNAVRELLTQLSLAKGTTVLEEKPKGSSAMRLDIYMGTDEWRGDFYKDSVLTKPLNLHLKLEPQTLDNLRTIELVELRDKTLPFKFQVDEVTKIRVKNPLKTYALVKRNERWELESSDDKVVVSHQLAQDLVDRLHRLEVYKYFVKVPSNTPSFNSEIELLDHKDVSVFNFKWSDFKDHEAWAKTNLLDEVFQIDDAQLNRLALNDIVKPKPSDKSPKAASEEKQ